MPADRKAIIKSYYEANKDARLLRNTITSILAGRHPWASTLKRFDLGERELNWIRSLDARFRTSMLYPLKPYMMARLRYPSCGCRMFGS